MAGQATQAAPAASAPAKSKSQLLDEIVSITEDTRVRLGARWGVPPSQVFAYGENFIALHRNCPEGFRVPPLLIAQFLQLAAEHDLNPARYEIRAFYDYQKGLQTFVMIDGWLTLANRQAQYDGYELTYERDTAGSLVACSALIYRKDRTRPTVARVKMTEWRDATKPQWQARPEWMLEQKAIKQGIRRAFGFAGIMDDDDAAKMGFDGEQAGDSKPVAPSAPPAPNLSDLKPAAPPPDDEYTSAAPRSVVSDVGEPGESTESEHTEESSPATPEVEADVIPAKTPIVIKWLGSKPHKKRVADMDDAELAEAEELARVNLEHPEATAQEKSHNQGVMNLIEEERKRREA